MRAITLALLSLLVAPVAQAEVFNTARTLKPGVLSAGLEFERHLPEAGDAWNVWLGLGVMPQLDLSLRASTLNTGGALSTWLGGDLELGLMNDVGASPAVSLTGGVHWIDQTTMWADGTLLMSKRLFNLLEPYIGADGQWRTDNWEIARYRGVAGLAISLGSAWEILGEMGWYPMEVGTPSYFSVGFNVYQ